MYLEDAANGMNMWAWKLAYFFRETRESLGELEKAVETLRQRLVFSQHFSFSQIFTRVQKPGDV